MSKRLHSELTGPGPEDLLTTNSPSAKKRRSSVTENGLNSSDVPESKSKKEVKANGMSEPKPVVPLSRIPKRPPVDNEGSSPRKTQAASAYNRQPDIIQPRDNRSRDDNYGSRPRRSRSPPNRRPQPDTSAYRRRSPPRQRRERTRSPSPIRDSPPREIIRPGGARGRGRNILAEQERLRLEREKVAQNAAANLSVQEQSNQFYSARPEWVKERGREWRKNESQIKGLRSFNNWVKSCIIQKFSPEEKGEEEELGWGEQPKEPEERKPLLVLDLGCGKGGDLGKWQLAPQPVGLYVGLDPAAISIQQATERYNHMKRGRKPIFDGRFLVKDCFGEWIGDVPIVREVGIDPNVGQPGSMRWGGGGFDVASMMFSMHYAFETEEKVRMMLRNISGTLKKGGRLLGVVPNSDKLAERIREWHKTHPNNPDPNSSPETKQAEANNHNKPPIPNHIPPSETDLAPSWGNSIYSVRFPPPSSTQTPTSPDGQFRPPFSWKYTYYMSEAVDVPEFVVPWEAFRAIALDFNLEQRWRRPFLEIWEVEKQDKEMRELAGRMGVLNADGEGLRLSEEEREAVGFYAGFCFVKI